jgi:hypothetical protein
MDWIKRVSLSFFIVVFSLFLVDVKVKAQADGLEHPQCPQPEDSRLTAVCGYVRSAMPQWDFIEGDNPAKVAGKPVEGVSVYIYEFAETLQGYFNPTGKDNGNLIHPFSSTWTTEEGRFRITMRRLGGLRQRYLVFMCQGKVAGLKKIPSYTPIDEVVEYVDCGDQASYAPPRMSLNYNDRNGYINCDMSTGKSADNTPNGNSPTQEVNFNRIQPKVTLNNFLDLEGADPRFILPNGFWQRTIGTPDVPLTNLKGPLLGAWWHHDCVLKYDSDEAKNGRLCMGADPSNLDETADEYRNKLYVDPRFTIQNNLPNIPPTPSLLFYKEFTARQDITEYIQNPVKPAQFLHTQFGDCIGKVYLRKFGEVKTDELIDCENFKRCNQGITPKDSYDVMNSQNTSGYANLLLDPLTPQRVYETEVNGTIPVCLNNGSKVTISAIQPSWDLTDGGGYTLTKEYFPNELIYYYGRRGGGAKLGWGFESTNDSFSAQDAAANQERWVSLHEERGLPQKGQSSAILSSGSANSNNSLVSAIGITSPGVNRGDEVLTDALATPFESTPSKLKYLSGTTIMDKDIGANHCMYSRINSPPVMEINMENEQTIIGNVFRNNIFTGNPAHYPENVANQDTGLATDPARTATSALFFSSAAIKRMHDLVGYELGAIGGAHAIENAPDWLNSGPLTGLLVFFMDIYDGVLTSSYGTGEVNISRWPEIADIYGAFMRVFGSTHLGLGELENKTFLDRRENSLQGGVQPMDHLMVAYGLSESNFEERFPLPLLPDPEGSTLYPSAWGEDACYPWHPVPLNGTCGTYPLGQLSRTCRVDECYVMHVSKSCDCDYTLFGTTGTLTGDGCTQDIHPDRIYDVDYHFTSTACAPAPGAATPFIDRLTCAQRQKTCLYSSGVTTPSPINPLPTPGASVADNRCISETYASGITSMLQDLKGACSGTIDRSAFCTIDSAGIEHCDTTHTDTEERSTNTPACAVSMAGPYTCAGDLKDVDTNLRVRQQTATETNQLFLDSIPVAENQMEQSWVAPYGERIVFKAGAEASTRSSINKDDPNDRRTKGKDFPAASGSAGNSAKSQIMATWAPPASFKAGLNFNEVFYHCLSLELPSIGLWPCPLQEVPNPEIVDIATLRSSMKAGCNLKTDDACVNAINGAGLGSLPAGYEFSETFRVILSAAGSTSNIPASALLVYLTRIGKTYQYADFFNVSGEPDLIKGSLPWYGVLGECDESDSSAVGAFDWILHWFSNAVDGGGNLALETVALHRGDTASRCNFLDAAYIAAAALAQGGGGGDCGSWTWDRMLPQLMTLTWGADRQGSYSEDSTLRNMSGIYNSCRQ